MSCSLRNSGPESKPDWKAYAVGELKHDERRQAEAHLASCPYCREELAEVSATLETLSALREEEIPRRIAFVSDKIFEPRWWQRVFSPTFAGACLVAAAILVHGALRPGQAQVDAAVAKAVAQNEARHMQEIQVLSDLIEQRDKQVNNMVLTSAALIR